MSRVQQSRQKILNAARSSDPIGNLMPSQASNRFRLDLRAALRARAKDITARRKPSVPDPDKQQPSGRSPGDQNPGTPGTNPLLDPGRWAGGGAYNYGGGYSPYPFEGPGGTDPYLIPHMRNKFTSR